MQCSVSDTDVPWGMLLGGRLVQACAVEQRRAYERLEEEDTHVP